MKTCLIADDVRTIRMVIAKIMQGLGFDVLEAEDGDDAVEQFVANKVDLVIVDSDMPVVSGMDVLYKIRSMKKVSQPKIIITASVFDMNQIDVAMHGGADDFIVRPLDADIIASKLEILGLLP